MKAVLSRIYQDIDAEYVLNNNEFFNRAKRRTSSHPRIRGNNYSVLILDDYVEVEESLSKYTVKSAEITINGIKSILYKNVVITDKTKKKHKEHYFWEITYKDITYKIYEVVLKSGDIYLCIYNDNELVSMIHRKILKKALTESYNIYAEDWVESKLLTLLSIYWDISSWKTRQFKDRKKLITQQEEMLSKYDKTFIARIVSNT